jgi:endonuclease YncB( thermonuclease family)
MPVQSSIKVARNQAWLLASSALCLLAFTAHLHAEVLVGRVIGVADGDTVTILDARLTQHRVRLAGIDAPERRQQYAVARS